MTATLAHRSVKLRPFFVLLMFDQGDQRRDTTCLEYSRAPFQVVLDYRSGRRRHRKVIKGRCTDWRLSMWIGPFPDADTALMFQQQWARAPCNLRPRRQRGLALAQRHRRTCFTVHPIVPETE